MRDLATLLLEVVAIALIAAGAGVLVAQVSLGGGLLVAGLVLLIAVWIASGAPLPKRGEV